MNHNGIEIDIIVPDLKTLEKDPKRTLLICIPKTLDIQAINEKITQMEKIQPEKENMWLVLSKNIPVGKKSFILI